VVRLHSFLALLAGLATTVAVQAALAALVRRAVPGWSDKAAAVTPGSAFVSLGSAFLAGAAGGFFGVWIAPGNPLGHALVLAIGVLLLAGASAVQQRGRLPVTLLLAQVAIAPLGVLAGGLLRLKMWGYF
jgi:hypothetical protein